MACLRANLSLSPFLLDGHLWVDPPIEPLAFLVAFDKGIMLTKIVANARLPTACCRLELVVGVLPFDVGVNLLEVHLAGLG
jgi:hypothetical protein